MLELSLYSRYEGVLSSIVFPQHDCKCMLHLSYKSEVVMRPLQ